MSGFTAEIEIRWADLDAQGHVNNVVYAEYLQEARVQLMAGRITTSFVVASHQIAYHHPIHYAPQPLRCQVRTASIGASRVVMAYELVQDGRMCAEARSVLCPYASGSRPRRLSDEERSLFAEAAGEDIDLRPLETPVLRGRGTVLPMRMRWSDPDRLGHVNNVRFLDYALAGRIDMTIRAHPSLARVGMGNPDAVNWLVARQDIDYLVSMPFRRDPFDVVTAPVSLGTNSVVLASEIRDPATLYAATRTVLVCADAQGNKRPLPDEGRRALEELLVSDAR